MPMSVLTKIEVQTCVCVFTWLLVKLRYDDPDSVFHQSCQKHIPLTDLVLASVLLDPPSLTISKSTSVLLISVFVTFRLNFPHCLSQPLSHIVPFPILWSFSPCDLPLSGLTQSSDIPLSHLSVTDRPVFQMAARLPSFLSVHIKLCLINAQFKGLLSSPPQMCIQLAL